SGYALNDALQGYAPYTGNARFTNLVANKQGSNSERVAGYDCKKENTVISGNDGSTNLLEVWRVADVRGLPPIRISTGSNATTSVLTLMKIQIRPPAEFLTSQEGFTKYDSPDAMVTELVARQHNFSRREGATFGYPANIERQPRPGQPY